MAISFPLLDFELFELFPEYFSVAAMEVYCLRRFDVKRAPTRQCLAKYVDLMK